MDIRCGVCLRDGTVRGSHPALALLRGLWWRRLAGLGHAHIGPNAEQDKGIFQAKFPLAGEEVGRLAAGLAHRESPWPCRVVFMVAFVAINTFITGRGITVTARTNFVLLVLELIALAIFVAIAIKYVFIDGEERAGSRSTRSTIRATSTSAL